MQALSTLIPMTSIVPSAAVSNGNANGAGAGGPGAAAFGLATVDGATAAVDRALAEAAMAYGRTAAAAAAAESADNCGAFLRKSTPGMIGKAKLNTIKITFTLVGVFLACWTPYYVMCLW